LQTHNFIWIIYDKSKIWSFQILETIVDRITSRTATTHTNNQMFRFSPDLALGFGFFPVCLGMRHCEQWSLLPLKKMQRATTWYDCDYTEYLTTCFIITILAKLTVKFVIYDGVGIGISLGLCTHRYLYSIRNLYVNLKMIYVNIKSEKEILHMTGQ
jgi:hypothetical protein